MNNVVFREPTSTEIDLIVKCDKTKMKSENLNIFQLSKLINVNYCNLTRVLNRKLVNLPIINKLNEWTNE